MNDVRFDLVLDAAERQNRRDRSNWRQPSAPERDSMQDEAILDGDYVLVEKSKTAHNGDIVVALVDGSDATLKRFFREGENVRLQPSNSAMKPIIVAGAAVEVQGRVIGVLRKY